MFARHVAHRITVPVGCVRAAVPMRKSMPPDIRGRGRHKRKMHLRRKQSSGLFARAVAQIAQGIPSFAQTAASRSVRSSRAVIRRLAGSLMHSDLSRMCRRIKKLTAFRLRRLRPMFEQGRSAISRNFSAWTVKRKRSAGTGPRFSFRRFGFFIESCMQPALL